MEWLLLGLGCVLVYLLGDEESPESSPDELERNRVHFGGGVGGGVDRNANRPRANDRDRRVKPPAKPAPVVDPAPVAEIPPVEPAESDPAK